MQDDKKTCLEFQQQAVPRRAQDGSAQAVAVFTAIWREDELCHTSLHMWNVIVKFCHFNLTIDLSN